MMSGHPSLPAGLRISEGLADRIRPIVAAVIMQSTNVLVWDDYNPATGEIVSVPLAGGIEFGETATQALAREIEEELRTPLAQATFLGVLEDIYEWAGQKRHELYFVYDVSVADAAIYKASEVLVTEEDGSTYPAHWRALGEFHAKRRLVPDGLLQLIEAARGRA
jgi:ADP-ribose pyrophosphatase YjhB (NUDIX family)